MRRVLASVAVATLLVACPEPSGAQADRRTRALALLEEGKRRMELGNLDQRRAALRLFERASLLVPEDPLVLVVVGDAYIATGYFNRARSKFERALALAPDNPDVHFGLARIHRQEWLVFAWPEDLRKAVDALHGAVRLRPGFVRAWAAMSALEVEAGNLPQAHTAAERAFEADPRQAEAQLVAAELSYRTGQIGRADTLFRRALARLDPGKAARFHEVRPLISPRDATRLESMTHTHQDAWVRRFWNSNDPDPVTPQNEARLEYWSRHAHALLLLEDPWGPTWRERTALYVRYGRHVQIDDPLRSERYEMPRLDLGEVAVQPSQAQLERLRKLTVGEGQSAFAPLPPGAVALPLTVRLIRFEGDSGARVLAQIGSPGAPGDLMTGECVVLDPEDRVITRASQRLSPSACDPTGERAGDFAFTLPPGSYRLAFAVHDTAQHRGTRQARCDLAAPTNRLSISELAPNCGPSDLAIGSGGVRILPNPRAHVEGAGPLVAYFEIYRLRTDDRGASQFEYRYEVRPVRVPGVPWYGAHLEGESAAEGLAYRTRQEGVGAMRRQFIQVPTRVLPVGRYKIEITVRDLRSGDVASEAMQFSRLWSQAELYGEPASR